MGESGKLLLGRYLEMVGSYGFATGGLVVNEALSSKKRKLNGSVSRIVGYNIRNCANEVENSLIPIVFKIPVRRWRQDSDKSSLYIPKEETIILKPGDTAIIESCDFIAYMLNNKTEHGLSLRNGAIKRTSRGGKDTKELDKLTVYTVDEAAYYCFAFSTKCKMRMHSPEIKKNISYKSEGMWKIKEEYKEYFGFLEMSGIHTRKSRRIVQQQVAERIRASYQLESDSL